MTLGLNLGRVDPSATLFEGTRILAHVEEERFCRVKKAVNRFPIEAIKYCLAQVEGGLDGLAAINIGFDLDRFTLDVPVYYLEEWAKYPDKPAEAARYEIGRLKEKHPDNVRARITAELTAAGLVTGSMPPIHWFNHHYCHALSGHLASPYRDSLGIVADANSEIDTFSVWECRGTRVERIYAKPLPHSLGWLYRAFTLFCGFDAYEGEGMLMGLAPYGKPDPVLAEKVARILPWRTDDEGAFEFDVDAEYVYLGKRWPGNDKLTEKLVATFGEPCPPGTETPSQYYKDLAYAVQERFEETLLRMVDRFVAQTGLRNVTLSGGVFLNCKANGRIWKELDSLEGIYIVPVASDDGIGVGANMAYAVENFSTERSDYALPDVYLGPEFSNADIKRAIDSFSLRRTVRNDAQYKALANTLGLDEAQVRRDLAGDAGHAQLKALAGQHLAGHCSHVEDLATYVAERLAEGKVVAWFQGRMEAGPRALGARSILADPRDMASLYKVNAKVKFRQVWRPFCPSLLDSAKDAYFFKPTQSPFMINTFGTTPLAKDVAPAIVHVDETARPQFLEPSANPLFHDLISAFHSLTGVPIVMNTSMNIKGEPICCTPEDALNFYFLTDADVLAMGNYVLEKN
ncbi:MAG: hypothetical protein JJ959_12480 [Nisaea sp.]|uniref:carbamoyltransferase family protein n=1 Tax=Nisaea sp. TaxID=2024842 RepID=UPI001B00C858|nr:carbamoyltransferase C-terminal domain-containing protein [Nisaea sp.]MBO6561350.1 hypothetical protein [Nisaea sp.]